MNSDFGTSAAGPDAIALDIELFARNYIGGEQNLSGLPRGNQIKVARTAHAKPTRCSAVAKRLRPCGCKVFPINRRTNSIANHSIDS
jgi:hypothetical protein